jgi:hypothetical protein
VELYFYSPIRLYGMNRDFFFIYKAYLPHYPSSALSHNIKFHFIFTVHLFIIDLFVPRNALRQFFHCFLYYKDAPIRISAIILPSSGGILRSFFT